MTYLCPVSIRARRIRPVVEQNYQLLYTQLCKSKVPIALVVTCVENMMTPTMDSWWKDNQLGLERRGLSFGGTVCVVSTRGAPSPSGGLIFDREYETSAKRVRDLIKTTCDLLPQDRKRSNSDHGINNAITITPSSRRRFLDWLRGSRPQRGGPACQASI